MIEVRIGDSRQLIHELTDKSIDCVMTSPPYWGLRDYGHPDQIGLEKTPEDYLNKLLNFFDDVKMKLKDEGNCFVNLGDTYSGSGCGTNDYRTEKSKSINGIGKNSVLYKTNGISQKFKGLPAKCLCMIPQRFAWGMIEHGWILRNEIIWAKPNHMPESVTDRLTKAHEVIYHFVKQGKYYYNLDAIREKPITEEKRDYGVVRGKIRHYDSKFGDNIAFYGGANTGTNNKEPYKQNNPHTMRLYQGKFDGNESPESFGSPRARTQRKPYAVQERQQPFVEYRENLPPLDVLKTYLNHYRKAKGLTMDDVEDTFGNMAAHHWFGGECYPSPGDWIRLKEILAFDEEYDDVMIQEFSKPSDKIDNPKGKNPGDVWTVNTQPFAGSHFAVFPLELVRMPILAGCPVNGTVLDPFGGSGTVGEFCRHNGRNAILFELNPEYKQLIDDRAMIKIKELSNYI